jgi:hypothetical protein
MKRLLILAALAAVAMSVLASTAAGYDRKPVRMYSLYYDGWGQTITSAEGNLRGRYTGVHSAYCMGAIMIGDESNSSWISGYTRYWDKLVCGGYSRTGHLFALVYDQKARGSWTMYRLKGATLADLY